MFYVYYLLDPVSADLLYIGRTDNIKARANAFRRRTGINVVLGIPQRHPTFEAACAAELKALRAFRPPYNQRIASSPAAYGRKMSPEARAHMSSLAKSAGRKPPGFSGQHSQEARAKMAQAKTGTTLSEATKAKMREAQQRRRQREMAAGS